MLEFVRHDITDRPLGRDADLVICFDMLLHQTEFGAFQSGLRNVLASVNKLALISYPTPGGVVAPIIDAPKEIMDEEIEFQKMFDKLDPSRPHMGAAAHGALPELIVNVSTEFNVRSILAYRRQTVYEVTKGLAAGS